MKPAYGVLMVVVWLPAVAQADLRTTSAPASNPTQAVSASASLDFNINIGKFLFFRVGNSAFPTVSSSVSTVTFNTLPSMPAPLSNGNNQAYNWNGSSTPAFTSSATTSLPVEVRSNAGQISIRATVSSPLSNGVQTIPMSQVSVVSSDSNLPAPPIPASGTGTAVNVAGTGFSNLVTQRSANWTFSWLGTSIPAAGTYNGQITFTAASP